MTEHTKRERKEPFYTGDLARPISIDSPLENLNGLAARVLHEDELQPIYERKLRALGVHYGGIQIDTEEGLLALVLAMARQHVPGFRLARPPGRDVEWTPERKQVLYEVVKQLQANHDLTIEQALERLETGSQFSPVTAARLLDVFKKARREHNQRELQVDTLLKKLASKAKGDLAGS